MEIIISNTNVGVLLKATDSILKKYGKETVPESIKGQVALSVIKTLSTGSHFSICNLDRLADMNGVTFSSEHHDFFQTLHCVDWKNIHPDTKEYMFALITDYFRGNIIMANTQHESTR
jgi:hypothetical protein